MYTSFTCQNSFPKFRLGLNKNDKTLFNSYLY